MNTALTALQSLSTAELVLGLLVLILGVSTLGYYIKNVKLREERETLQRDYAPRRKRVYQAFLGAANTFLTSGDDTFAQAKRGLAGLFPDIALWGGDAVVRGASRLKTMLEQEPNRDRLEDAVTDMMLLMRADMGFENRRVGRRTLSNLLR